MFDEDIETIKKQNMNLADEIYILDTTLRDGEQTPGVALTVDDKIQIAQKLDNVGVDKIEVGFPASSKGELISSKQIKSLNLSSTVVGLARSVKNDIDAVLDADLDYIHTFIGTSPLHRDYKLKMSKETTISTAVEAVEYAKDHGLSVEFSAEDATRTERDFLFEIYRDVVDAGADFLDIPDTVGILTPIITRDLITDIKSNFKTPISVHFHNDFGLATANTLTAIECGANQAHVTVNGIGERTGNTSLEEIVVALHSAYGIKLNVDTSQLYSLSEFVGRLTGIKMPVNKPIVGDNAFAHESGIHVHGILNNSSTYEPISPELVGHSRKIVLGKHTGANALKSKLKEYHIDLNDEQFDKVFNQIKALGDKGKCVTDDDLKAIALTELGSARETPIKLKGLGLLCGAIVSPTATVKLEIDGVEKETSDTGVGPVDAALNAIRDLIQDTMDIELEEYNLEAINGGTDALADVFVISSDKEGNKSTGRAINDDIVMASILAVLDSINKLLLIKRSEI
ncbi:MAG: 2-isopropylmalate synthase [Methanobrevibacter sp.]|uniref:2-isopropylmalate synthase n=1 Tax=Methanobrevibacter millerae TaxID=230361 RepID=A0A8T3VNT1_9EURY|nr:2-isopropylmalate synthase [Methanobrevibacter sp.]MBE6509716.1 2-isopropylmalate synthase [Methanobrevibacter millerae]MBO5150946.1 2-isopropylmalate synthase [Methanobrevibacter sp.]